MPVALARTKLSEEQESPAAAAGEAKTGLLESVPPLWGPTASASLGEAVSHALGGSGEVSTLDLNCVKFHFLNSKIRELDQINHFQFL